MGTHFCPDVQSPAYLNLLVHRFGKPAHQTLHFNRLDSLLLQRIRFHRSACPLPIRTQCFLTFRTLAYQNLLVHRFGRSAYQNICFHWLALPSLQNVRYCFASPTLAIRTFCFLLWGPRAYQNLIGHQFGQPVYTAPFCWATCCEQKTSPGSIVFPNCLIW